MDSKDKNTSNKADILDKIKKGTKFILSYKKTMFSLLGCSGSISIASFLGVPLNEIIKYTKWIIKMEELFNNIPQITSWIVFALGVASAVFSKIKEKGFKSSLKGASIYLDSVWEDIEEAKDPNSEGGTKVTKTELVQIIKGLKSFLKD